MYYGDKWDPTNDTSYEGLKIFTEDDAFFGTGNEVKTDKICVYTDGVLIGGVEPDGSVPDTGSSETTATTTTTTTTSTTTTVTTTTITTTLESTATTNTTTGTTEEHVICENCKNDFPADEIIVTPLGMRLCKDCRALGIGGTTPTMPTVTTTDTTTSTVPTSTVVPNTSTTASADDIDYGDINLDGDVSLLDVVTLNKYIAGAVSLGDAALNNSSCCYDGVINGLDVTALLKYVVEAIDFLPITV
jgi:hypothetical protein